MVNIQNVFGCKIIVHRQKLEPCERPLFAVITIPIVVLIVHVAICVLHLSIWIQWPTILVNGLAIHDKTHVGFRTLIWIIVTESVKRK